MPYIQYWDKVISDWFHGTIDPNQQLYNKLLNPDYLPEPYWGDPDHCSFVIVNYNPGGVNNYDPHTYIKCANNACNVQTLIKEVKKRGYSNIALQFPLLMSQNELCAKGWCWFLNYGGYHWWQKKKVWFIHIANAAGVKSIDKGLMPFAIELCPWHSPRWIGVKPLLNMPLKATIGTYIIDPIIYAIYHSNSKIGFFIGREHVDVLNAFSFTQITQPFQPIPNLKRFYQVFKKVHNGIDLYAIVTWVFGSNNYPSSKYYTAEDTMIHNIINRKNPIYP